MALTSSVQRSASGVIGCSQTHCSEKGVNRFSTSPSDLTVTHSPTVSNRELTVSIGYSGALQGLTVTHSPTVSNRELIVSIGYSGALQELTVTHSPAVSNRELTVSIATAVPFRG